MKLLVTGASGFLGGEMGKAAAAAGYDVVGLGRKMHPPASWPGKYLRVDFDSVEALARVIRAEAADRIAHFAGTASVAQSFQDPTADFESSTALWFRLLEAIRRSETRPIVAFASSAAVYGSPAMLPTPETAPRRPESPYGFHKKLSEQVAEEYASCYGMSVLALRFFSVFGAAQRRLLVWEIFDQLQRGACELRLKGTGDERRDFLAVEEATCAAVGVLTTALPEEGFHSINLASGTSVSVREVAETLRACAGSAAQIIFGCEELRGNPARWEADIHELRRRVPDWEPMLFSKSLALCADAWNADRKLESANGVC